jgi:photosystem II stability/assembly factor-like uncharacterized protein
MKKAIVLILLLQVSHYIFSQSGWQRMQFSYNTNIADVQFVNENTGYLASGRDFAPGSVFKSINGGLTWQLVFQTSKPMRAIYFSSASTGTVVGQHTNLRRTYTGGYIWYWFAPPMGYNSIDAVHFVGDKTGWVAGDSGYVFRTYDYSATWINVSPGPMDITWYDIYFMNYNTGIVVGESGTHSPIMRTTDAGNNWTEISGFTGYWKRISFCNELTGYIAGNTGSTGLIKTTNGGLSWFVSGYASEYNDVFCVNENVAYAVGSNGTIHKTTDGGTEWNVLNSGTNASLFGIHFNNTETGWVVGNNGVILKTTTGGIVPIGIHNTGSGVPDNFSLQQNYPNPFNPNTTIRFAIPLVGNGRDRSVKLFVYDLLGREVTTLVNEQLNPGIYEVNWDAPNYPSGTYFYRLDASDFTETKKMVLLK